jgi:hypothetical protein
LEVETPTAATMQVVWKNELADKKINVNTKLLRKLSKLSFPSLRVISDAVDRYRHECYLQQDTTSAQLFVIAEVMSCEPETDVELEDLPNDQRLDQIRGREDARLLQDRLDRMEVQMLQQITALKKQVGDLMAWKTKTLATMRAGQSLRPREGASNAQSSSSEEEEEDNDEGEEEVKHDDGGNDDDDDDKQVEPRAEQAASESEDDDDEDNDDEDDEEDDDEEQAPTCSKKRCNRATTRKKNGQWRKQCPGCSVSYKPK